MIKRSKLTALAVLTAVVAAGDLSAADPVTEATSLDPCINGQVSASGRFPTQSMEDEFNRYRTWVTENGLGLEHALSTASQPVHALEASIDATVSASGRFPSQTMEDEYRAYVAWTRQVGLDTIYAF